MSVQFSSIKSLHRAIFTTSISRTFSSSQTETPHPLNISHPLLLQPRVAGGGAGTPSAAPSPRAENGPGSRSEDIHTHKAREPGDLRGTWGFTFPKRPGLCRACSYGSSPRESVPRVPSEVLGTWMGSSLAPHHCTFYIYSWRMIGHFRPKSSLS